MRVMRYFVIGSLVACSLAWAGDVPWLAEVQRAPSDGFAPLPPVISEADGTLDPWLQQRVVLREEWLDFLGRMPERPPVRLATISEDYPEGVRRVLVRYACETGIETEGYLLYPEPLGDSPRPGVVALHSTTAETIDEIAGVRGRDSRALGLKLAQEGFVVFCPKNFLWHDPALDYGDAAAAFLARRPGVTGMAKMLNDAQCAVDILASLPEVDAERIGAVGHSLGAKEALYLAAFDERIRAAVASEGGIGLTFTNWHDPWYLGSAIYEPGFALDHHQLLALIAPRAFLILAGESGPPTMSVADGDRTWPYVEAALPVYRLYGAPARIGLYNHREGHTIPEEAYGRLVGWLREYLGLPDN